MTAAAFLADLRRAGVELFADASRLRFRAPAGAVTASMREAAAACREELLTLVAVPDGWDAAAAAETLLACNSFLDHALSAAPLMAIQRAVVKVLRGVVNAHSAQHDSLLWDDMAFLTEQVAGWKALNSAPQKPSPAPFSATPRPTSWWRTGDEVDLLDLVKELFPPEGVAPKVGDWRSTGPRNANAASAAPRREIA
jgi:TubC N-terminal docking domain